MYNTFRLLMRNATRLTRSGQLKAATAAIQRALSGRDATPAPPRAPPPSPTQWVERVDVPTAQAASAALDAQRPAETLIPPAVPATPPPEPRGSGHFMGGSHAHGGLVRAYKLFVPPGPHGTAPTLVVMLHGCTQDPDDFAAGTGMNEAARQQGFFVLYPAQPADANPQRCWNWFKHNHQQRGRGEPALIHNLVQALVAQRGIDPARVYVAGLSAGGAMASILAGAYPETFAAVGVHSGLVQGAAVNLPEALAAMRGGAANKTQGAAMGTPVATIVFHGDGDATVHPRNGEQVLAAARGTHGGAAQVEQGVSPGGRRYTRSVHEAAPGAAPAEHWLLHGQGHAWSGGSGEGTYTDASGPSATAEMLRFFFAHPRRLAH
jgi:poly(hydroxyalkanoate) depolymerase family esterase